MQTKNVNKRKRFKNRANRTRNNIKNDLSMTLMRQKMTLIVYYFKNDDLT